MTKKVKIYYNVEFYEYETAHNTDISNKFQYTEFNKYKELKIVEINISELTNQNTFTKSSIEFSIKVQNINFYNTFQNILFKIININIT